MKVEVVGGEAVEVLDWMDATFFDLYRVHESTMKFWARGDVVIVLHLNGSVVVVNLTGRRAVSGADLATHTLKLTYMRPPEKVILTPDD